MTQKFYAKFQATGLRFQLGPYPTREKALAAAVAHWPRPKPKSLYTGYGEGLPSFDLRWHDAEAREHWLDERN